MEDGNIRVAFVPLDVILPLREAVIIRGTRRDTPYFPGDNDPDTRHVAALAQDGCIACATLMRSEFEGVPAWQLRGMAVAPLRQRQGLGRTLLHFIEAELPSLASAAGIWCNARETALAFYTSMGFHTVSDRFTIENVGPHFRLYKEFPHGKGVNAGDARHADL